MAADLTKLASQLVRDLKTAFWLPPYDTANVSKVIEQMVELHDRAKAYFNNAVLNDTLFLSLINVVDYSILVGMDEENKELVVGIIDYMRQYDIIKKMERMGKSVGMIAGQAEPTVIQPPNYRNRFQAAMERYFMMVPDKWTIFRMRGDQA